MNTDWWNHSRWLSIGIVNRREAYRDDTLSRRRAGAVHHIAFRASTPEEVDQMYLKIREIPAAIVHAPRYYPEYCPDYYAVFFKDSEGIEYEIVSFEREKHFKEE